MKANSFHTTNVSKEARSGSRETFREMEHMADSEVKRLLFKLFSVLLQYPDEALVQSVQAGKDYLAHFSHGPWGAVCLGFLQHLEKTPMISLQEDYVRIFDLRPSTCLNLTFHEFGDSKIRGVALAELSQLYQDAGYESSTEELPDFLPLMLEFLSVCSSDTALRILERYQKQIKGLAQRLREVGSPYGNVLETLSLFIDEFVALEIRI
jgi:nitrate reductase delta subunit